MSKKTTSEGLPPYAAQWFEQRRLGFERLDHLRRQAIREMTESESAKIFAQLDPPRPYQLRPSSGLIEQQRWFRLLRQPRDERSQG